MKSLLKKIITALLVFEARLVLKKYHPKVIAITGSVGKTSTKDAIYTVLANTSSYVRKSEKSFNSEIGVPLTILGCENAWSDPFLWLSNLFHGLELIIFKSSYPDSLVLEVGVDHPGDITRTAKLIKPDVVVVTNVSAVPVHVEFFPSREALLLEKSQLVRIAKKDAILILSEDDEDVRKMAEGMSQKCLTFGMRHSATVSASNEAIMYEEREFYNGKLRVPSGMAFKINYNGNSFPIVADGVLGVQHIYPLLGAATVGISQGLLMADIVQSLGKHVPARGRVNVIAGVNGSTLIDDTYNSSPDAVREALLVLGKIETTGRKIAILGDMMELGKYSLEEHKKAGELARKVASIVVTVGQRSKAMGESIKSFATSYEASDYAREIVGKGDIVLIKGSQSMRMERVTKILLAEPEKAGKLLVRQEDEWLAKK